MSGFKFKVGDKVILTVSGRDYGKMCTVIEVNEHDENAMVKIKLINPHDAFEYDMYRAGVTEGWMNVYDLKLVKHE